MTHYQLAWWNAEQMRCALVVARRRRIPVVDALDLVSLAFRAQYGSLIINPSTTN